MLLLFFFFLRETFAVNNGCTTDIYDTTFGPICGSLETTKIGTVFKSFQGIPFASPPLKELRFKKPIEPTPWTEVLDLSSMSTKFCVQEDFFFGQPLAGQEDCLYINVYAPDVIDSNLPVMVWLYGGGFTAGSGTWGEYGPHKFLDTQKVIMVTINYRLNALGWLSLGGEGVDGNQGLYDMVAGLKWVQNNIGNFGGDPDQVTIFGESAGSWACSYLLVSPLAKGLFRRAIMESGAWTHPYWRLLTKNEAERIGTYGADKLNCTAGTSAENLQCLQNVDTLSLINLNKDAFFFPPAAVIDGEMITELPHDTVASGDINGVEIIIGANKDEGLLETGNFLVDPSLYDLEKAMFDTFGPMQFFGKRFQDNVTDITQLDIDQSHQVLEHFVGSLDDINADHFDNITNILSSEYWFCTHSLAEMLTKQGLSVFQYLFTYKGENGYLDFLGVDSKQYGVCHADELYLMWNPYWFVNYTLNEDDSAMGEIMVKYWVDFASTGDPSPPDSDLAIWNPVDLENHQYLRIDTVPIMEATQEYYDRMEFWKEITQQRPLP